jgi:hypothetical protein
MLSNNLADVYAQDLMAGVFYSIYGINDWVFLFSLSSFLSKNVK